MAILKPSYGTVVTIVTTGLAALANTASVTSDVEHDNTADLFIDIEFQLQFTAAGATTGSIDVYVINGLTTGSLSSTAKTSNMRRLGSVELNGTTAVSKTLALNMDSVGAFWKLHFINSSGAALATETVSMRGINFTDV